MRYDLVQQAVYMIMAYQDWVAILGPNAEDILTSGMTFTAETVTTLSLKSDSFSRHARRNRPR